MAELHELVCQNDYDRLEEEVKQGKHDINARDEEWGYRHAIHWAAQKGFGECIRLLVEYGAWIYAKDYRGWTAAHYAAEAGKLPVCRTLFTLKCPLDHEDKWGMTPYDVAVVYGHKDCATFLYQSMLDIAERRGAFYEAKKSKPSSKPSSKQKKSKSGQSSESEAEKAKDFFEFDQEDPHWQTFFNLEWGNSEFEGVQSTIYIPYLMTGA